MPIEYVLHILDELPLHRPADRRQLAEQDLPQLYVHQLMCRKDEIRRPQQLLTRGILHRENRHIRARPKSVLHLPVLRLGKERKEDDAGEPYPRPFDQAQEDLGLQPVQFAPDNEHGAPPRERLPRTRETALERRLLTPNRLLRRRFPMAACADAAQPVCRLLRAARKRLREIRRTEARVKLLRERDEHCLLFIGHRTAEHDEEFRLRHRLHLIERRIGGKLPCQLQPEAAEQPLQLLHVGTVKSPVVSEKHHHPLPHARRRLHKAIHQHPRNRQVTVEGLIVQKAARRNGNDGQPQLLLHLLRRSPRIVPNDAAHTGTRDKDGTRLISFRRKTDARTQPLRRAEHRIALTDPARQQRYGRRRRVGARADQPMKAADILFAHHMCTGARTVKDDQCAPRIRERPPDRGHAAAALRTPHPRAFYLNRHTAPPCPPTTQISSVPRHPKQRIMLRILCPRADIHHKIPYMRKNFRAF